MGSDELRPLLVVGAFVGLFVLLVNALPANLFLSPYAGSTTPPPLFREARVQFSEYDMWVINDTECDWWMPLNYSRAHFSTFNATGPTTFVFNLIELDGFYQKWQIGTTYSVSVFSWLTWSWTTQWVTMYATLYNWEGAAVGSTVTAEQMNYDYSRNDQEILQYDLQFIRGDYPAMSLLLSFDENAFETPWDAFLNQSLVVLFGVVAVSDAAESMNAMSLLQALLSFRTLNIDPTLFAIIAIPITISLAYFGVWVITKLIHGS